MELSLPPQYPDRIYIPVYTLDGVIFKALESSTDVHSAKSRLRSILPPAWEVSHTDFKDKYKNLRCGLLTFQIGKTPFSITEFPIEEFLKG